MIIYSHTREIMCQRIRSLRKKAHFTQQQMADKLQTSRRTYGNYERGEHAMPAEVMAEIANILNTTMDYLCGREDKAEGAVADEI